MKTTIISFSIIILCQAAVLVECSHVRLKGKVAKESKTRKSKKKKTSVKAQKKKKSKKGATDSDNCMEVILTGTAPGPTLYRGLAGAGTLVTYGSIENDCRDTLLQFDVGRATTTQLSKLDLEPASIDAVFFTHMHSDHVDDMSIFMFHFWLLSFGRATAKDIFCAENVKVGNHTISCQNYMDAIGDAFIASGEVAQRNTEFNGSLGLQGPAELANVITFDQNDATPQEIWKSSDGNVSVRYITSNHIGGHASFRVDTPVGSVVIAGDASNDEQDPNSRLSSTSTQVESLASNADILVHSAIHSAFATVIPPNLYNRQSNAIDIGAMGQRAGVGTIMLTHLSPALGSNSFGPFSLPDHPPFTENDFLRSVENEGGFEGEVVVGGDLSTIRLV